MELLLLTLELDRDQRLSFMTGLYLEWPELDILLDDWVIELSTDESLDIKDGVGWVSSSLVLGSLTNLSLFFSESDIRWSGSVTLLVLNDDNLVTFHDSDTRVSGTE